MSIDSPPTNEIVATDETLATSPAHAQSKTLRVAVIGCGAVARQFHLPVLAGHPDVALAALVDHDLASVEQLAKSYGVPNAERDFSNLPVDSFDAAVIATPPSHHAPCALDLLSGGRHVLVEKPMAINYQDAARMVAAAERHGVVLSVGLFRRLLPSLRLLKAALDQGAAGRLLKVDVAAGSVYGWPLASLGNMLKAQSGGGVLMDIGSHVFDQLLYLFPDNPRVKSYRDNSLGGIETDCVAELQLNHDGRLVDARVTLSRTRKLRGTLQIHCEHQTLEMKTTEPHRVHIAPRNSELIDPATGQPRDYDQTLVWRDIPDRPGYEMFRAEFDDWIAAIRAGTEPRLSGRSVLPTVKLIDTCYGNSEQLVEPWVSEGLNSAKNVDEDRNHLGSSSAVFARAQPYRRVLVTGATGFIGCRVAELLHGAEGYDVRALVHNPGNAARLARLPIDMIHGDLRDPQDVARAMEDCDAVVHCAIGTEYGYARKIREVTIGGTRRLAEAALAAGVKRFVHISTTAVHGNDVQGVLDETTPVRPSRHDDYGRAKATAEREIERAADRGLPTVTLRLANIYGPYCPNLIVRPVTFLIQDALCIAGDISRPSNTVYVDNVAAAIARALTADAGEVAGRQFVLGADDDWSWDEFFTYFSDELGGSLRSISPEEFRRLRPLPKRGTPWSWAASWLRGMKLILTSSEFKSLGRRLLATDPVGRGPRYLIENVPVIRRTIEGILGAGGADVYLRPADDDAPAPMAMNPLDARVCNERAYAVLGYEPRVTRERAMLLTREWLVQSGLVGVSRD
jgi:predicted dehydrogenase/nucleoside-diphosphate-sugar epimerase